jgi:hypothetical protein
MRLVASNVSKVFDSLTEVKGYFVEISEKGSQRHNSLLNPSHPTQT